MTRYTDLLRADRRLVILRLTAEGNGSANDSILRRGLEVWGLPCSRDGLAEDVARLVEEGCAERGDLPDDHYVVRITGRGRDVVAGTITVAGITRPESL